MGFTSLGGVLEDDVKIQRVDILRGLSCTLTVVYSGLYSFVQIL